MTLEESIAHFAKLTPDKAAVISQGQTLSYAGLWERIQEKARQLRDEGLREGQPYAFVTTQDADFIVTYCAVHLCGAVSVPTPSNSKTLSDCPLKQRTEGRKPHPIEDELLPLEGEGMRRGSILYTTGTTGDAKGVMVSEKAWTANAENLIDRLGFTPDLLFIICGPLNHLGLWCFLLCLRAAFQQVCLFPRALQHQDAVAVGSEGTCRRQP